MSEWTEQEERAFAEIMAAGKIERLPAIRLYRRCRGDLRKALKYARKQAPNRRAVDKLSQAREAKRRKADSIDGNRLASRSLPFDRANHVATV